VLAAILLLGACAGAPPRAAHLGPPFLDSWPAAQRAAQAQRKPIFVDAWAPWCHTCLSMRAFVLADEALRPYYDRYVWVALDVEQASSAAFLERYPIGSLPTFVVLDAASGAVARRWLGAMTKAELLRFLDDGLLAVTKPQDVHLELLRGAHGLLLSGETGRAITQYLTLLDAASPQWPRRWEALVAALDALNRKGDEAAMARCVDLVERELPWASDHASPMGGDFVAYAEECVGRLATAQPNRVSSVRRRLVTHLVKLVDDLAAPLAADDRGDALGLLRELYTTLGERSSADAVAARRQQLLDEAAARATDPLVQSTYDWARAETYLWLGQGDRAIAMLTERERQLPGDYNAAHRLGRVYLELGRAAEAIAACDRALAKAYGPRRVEILGLRADALDKHGQRAAAVAAAQLAVAELARLPVAQQKPRLLRSTAARVKRLQTPEETGR